jgi:hypothetical protein
LHVLLVPLTDVGGATPGLLSGIRQIVRGRQRIGLVVIAVLEDLVEWNVMMVEREVATVGEYGRDV